MSVVNWKGQCKDPPGVIIESSSMHIFITLLRPPCNLFTIQALIIPAIFSWKYSYKYFQINNNITIILYTLVFHSNIDVRLMKL